MRDTLDQIQSEKSPRMCIGSATAYVQLGVTRASDRGSPKKRAAMRWLERYLVETSPRLQHFAQVAGDLATREARG